MKENLVIEVEKVSRRMTRGLIFSLAAISVMSCIACVVGYMNIDSPVYAEQKDRWHESDYQEYANKTIFHGVTEHVLDDGTRIDIYVKDKYAIEVDFANKWYEAVGQASHYAYKTNTPPAIYLIIREDRDIEKVSRAKEVCRRLYIVLDGKIVGYTVFTVDNRDNSLSNQDTRSEDE